MLCYDRKQAFLERVFSVQTHITRSREPRNTVVVGSEDSKVGGMHVLLTYFSV